MFDSVVKETHSKRLLNITPAPEPLRLCVFLFKVSSKGLRTALSPTSLTAHCLLLRVESFDWQTGRS